jgi:hypothetical protein
MIQEQVKYTDIREGLLSRAGDTVYAFRFVRLLVQKWEKTEAFKLGIIDKNGKKIKKPTLPAEKAAYTYFHRLVYNIKRLIGKIPFGKSALASWATALFLLKEQTGLTDAEIEKAFEGILDFDSTELKESTETWIQSDGNLNPGKYILTQDIMSPSTADFIGLKGTTVLAEDFLKPFGFIFETPIYLVKHELTKHNLYISIGDIKR